MKNVLRSLKPLAFPFIHSAFPRIQRARPRSSFVRANPDPTACPQAGASAEPPAEAKPALSATCLPSAGSQAGRGLLTRSGNAAFRRQPPQTTHARRGLLTAPIPDATAARSDVAQMAKSGCVDACLPATALRACLETTRGAVFGEKAGWRGATKENIPGGSSTEEQRSQTAFSPKTLRAPGLLSLAGVGSVVTARCGDASTSPPWPQPKSLAAAPLVVSKQALSAGGHQISHREGFDNSLSLNEVAEPSPINRLAGTPKHKAGTARLPPNGDLAFDYLAPCAEPPQLPQGSAPKRLSADSRPQLFPTSAFFILPSAFAFCLHSPAILS